jgi:hypothetical protein
MEENGAVQWYVFDGQHRASVLREYFEKNPVSEDSEASRMNDFQIPIMWKLYDAKETAKIHKDFLDCNRASPIEWTVDPNMMANAYIDSLLLKFHGPPMKTGKKSKKDEKSFFRVGKTKKPYLSIEKVREEIVKKYTMVGWTKKAEEFADQAFQVNERLLEGLAAKEKRTTLETNMLDIGFALAAVESYMWI